LYKSQIDALKKENAQLKANNDAQKEQLGILEVEIQNNALRKEIAQLKADADAKEAQLRIIDDKIKIARDKAKEQASQLPWLQPDSEEHTWAVESGSILSAKLKEIASGIDSELKVLKEHSRRKQEFKDKWAAMQNKE
jgi:hypothetical protein